MALLNREGHLINGEVAKFVLELPLLLIHEVRRGHAL
jgi:hypothetical protein